jgi:hypothetical protein
MSCYAVLELYHSFAAVDFLLRFIQLSFRFDAERHNARINAAGRIERSIRALRMTSKLVPLALNELLCRPLDSSIQLSLWTSCSVSFNSTLF